MMKVGSASTEEVFGGELLEAHEAEALRTEVAFGIEVFERAAVGDEAVIRFTARERRHRKLRDLRRSECRLNFGVCAECRCAFLQ